MSKYKIGDVLVNKRTIQINEELLIEEVLSGSSDIYYRVKKDDGTHAFVVESEFEENK